ncbi:hypothetical protein [Aquimarina pacifica]|uniref:hypothetical protein n=1 Tax=Aquimarina pacifica TaxID=1296415 RepID=UPI00046FBA55|nr:hypothetical protein [Aquimarina pacifica]
MKKFFSITIVFILLITSCTEEDKHPELPLFTENLSEKLIIAELDIDLNFITDTDDFIYIKDDRNNHMIIIHRDTKQIIKKFTVGNKFLISEEGDIYYCKEESTIYNTVETYKAKAPNFDESIIPKDYLGYMQIDSILSENKDEMRRLDLKYTKSDSLNLNDRYFDYLKKKTNENIKNRVLKDYEYILDGLAYTIIKYKDGREYDIFFQKFRYDDFPEEINYRYENKSRSKASDYINKEYILREFDDHSLLRYRFSGGNHFAPGIKTSLLYYYECTLKNKSFKFKSENIIEQVISFDEDILIKSKEKTYRITLK